MTCLGEVATLERRSLAPEEIESGTNYPGLEHIESGGRILGYQRVDAGELQSNKFMFDPGTLLYGKLRPYLAKICIPDRDGCCSTDILPIRPGKELDIRYLKHLFLWRPYVDKANSLCAGANLPRISPSSLLGIEIPLPPMEEQRRIAAMLDKASDLSIKIKKASKLEYELNASIFNDIIGDPALNPLGLPRVPLIDICSTSDHIKCGPFGTQLKQHEFRESGVPLWGIKHVNRRFQLSTNEFLDRETADRLSAYSLLEGDIVMTRKGTVGNCCVYPSGLPPGVMHSDLLRIRLDSSKCLPGFVSYQLHHSHDVKRQIDLISGGAIMAGINVGKLKSISILVPGIDMQRRFELLATAASRGIWKAKASMLHYSHDLMNSLSARLMASKDSSLIPQ